MIAAGDELDLDLLAYGSGQVLSTRHRYRWILFAVDDQHRATDFPGEREQIVSRRVFKLLRKERLADPQILPGTG